jgi:hypothetical protein
MAMELFPTVDAIDGNTLIDPFILSSLHIFWQAPFMCEMHNCIVLDVAIGTIFVTTNIGSILGCCFLIAILPLLDS